MRCILGKHLNKVYIKEALLLIIVAIFLETPCSNDENYQCALSTLEGKDESSWSPIEKPSMSFPFRTQRFYNKKTDNSSQICSLCILRVCLGSTQLVKIHAVQHGRARTEFCEENQGTEGFNLA